MLVAALTLTGCGAVDEDPRDADAPASSGATGGATLTSGGSPGGGTGGVPTGTGATGGTAARQGPAPPYVCGTDQVWADEGEATEEQLTPLYGIYRVVASIKNTSCPGSDGPPLVGTEVVRLGPNGTDLRVFDCTSETACDDRYMPRWLASPIDTVAGDAFVGHDYVTERIDTATELCSSIMAFRYIVATPSGARLEERLRLSDCDPERLVAWDFPTDIVPLEPCECVAESYELERIE